MADVADSSAGTEKGKSWAVQVWLPPEARAKLNAEAARRNAHPDLGVVRWTRTTVARALILQALG
jgi:hypothetical protein